MVSSFEQRPEDQEQNQAMLITDDSAHVMGTNPWRACASMSRDQSLSQTVDYQLFKAHYASLRNQFSETF